MPVGLYTGAQTSIGNGVTTVFPYSWRILDQSHVEVKVDGVTKTIGSDYTVSGVGSSAGGNVTFLTAPANGAVVQRARKVPYKRDTDYQTNGDFKEETVDADFDLTEMQVQQLAADIVRAFKAPLSVTTDLTLTDAQWAARASLLLGFDTGGNFGLFSGLNTSLVAVSSAMQPVVAAVTLALARVAMGVAASGANTDITSIGAVTGVTATAGDSTTKLATTAFVQQALTSGRFGNRIINGNMQRDQRNAGAAKTFTAGAALSYCIDRWYGYCTGANVNGQRVAGSGRAKNRFQFTGAASVTAIGFGQRIPQALSYDMNSQTAYLSVDLANSLLTTVSWAAYYANSADTFGTLASPTRTSIASGSFTVNSTVARYSTSFAVPGAGTTGIEIVFTVGAQTSGTWTIGDVSLDLVPVPNFEARPDPIEQLLCEWFLKYLGFSSGGIGAEGYIGPSGQLLETVGFAPMRTTPTATIQGTWTVTNCAQPTIFGTPAVNSVAFAAVGTASGSDAQAYTGSTSGIKLECEL